MLVLTEIKLVSTVARHSRTEGAAATAMGVPLLIEGLATPGSISQVVFALRREVVLSAATAIRVHFNQVSPH